MLANRLIGLARGGGGVNEDTFDTDSTAQYTQFADTPATWTISGGELVATGGDQAVFVRNGTSYTDVVIEADVNWSFSGGLVLRFIDNNNYYLAAFCDDSGANPSYNVQVFKRVSGSFTQIFPNVGLTWTRGASKKIRFSASGTTLKVFVDDVEMFSASDASIAGPGGVGVRNWGGGSNQTKYQAFRWGL